MQFTIPLADWLPDQPPTATKGTPYLKNVYPVANGYKPIKDLVAISSNSLDSKALGAFSGQKSDGTVSSFAGDSTKLYQLSGGAYSNVSKAGDYTLNAEDRWAFIQFGDRIIATNISTPAQYFDMASSTLFANLAGSPPQARYGAVVREFVVLANTADGVNNVAWSGFNNSEQWTPGTNQADEQDLPDGGWIHGITGGEVGYIFQEHAITRMTYVGPPAIFQFDTIERNRGLAAPGSLIQVGSMIFFRSHDGFYVLEGSTGVSRPIGTEKIDRWFKDEAGPGVISQMSSAFDADNKLVFWSFVSGGASDPETPDRILVYNWATDKWGNAELEHDMIYSGLTEGLTLEQLDAIYGSLEDIPGSLDSRAWTGGAYQISAFDPDHTLSTFSGDTLEAVVDSTEFEAIPGRRSRLLNIRPLCDTSAATALVRSREKLSADLTDGTSASMVDSGDIPVNQTGRTHRAQVTIPAGSDWNYIHGLEIEAVDEGSR